MHLGQIEQIYRDLDRLVPHPLWEVVQDLHSTAPTRGNMSLDHADYTGPNRQHELDHTDHTDQEIDLP